MDGSHLPDDLAAWPDDPAELLGVGYDADRRQLRRAYARLIRLYKPEHFPEHFRRIRDAYESLDRFAQFRALAEEASGEPAEQSPSPAPPRIRERAPLEEPSEGETVPVLAPLDQPAADTHLGADEATGLWRRAQCGDAAEAYRGYCRLREQSPDDEEYSIRLYWLLALAPATDPLRHRLDWLAEGLAACGLQGRLMELYRRELADDPEEALSPRAVRLLQSPAPPARLAGFAAKRWEAAASLGRWQVIPQDLTQLRARLYQQDRVAWAGLLLEAAGYLCWEEDEKAISVGIACRRELEECGEEHAALAGELDRADMRDGVIQAWHRLRDADAFPQEFLLALRGVLRRRTGIAGPASRPPLRELLLPMIRDPFGALASLDRIKNLGPAILHCLCPEVERLCDEACAGQGDPGRLNSDVAQFLGTHDWGLYEKLRPSLLTFCLRHSVTSDGFARSAAATISEERLHEALLIEKCREDLPLRLLVAGCLAFWTL